MTGGKAMTEQANSDITSTASDQTQAANALLTIATRHRAVEAQERAVFGAALRVAFGRMAAEYQGLDAVVQSVDARQAALAEVLDLMETGVFLAVLEGRGERMGLVMACPTLLAGMIEAQTTGRVDPGTVPKRKPTRTDAALLSPMVDAFLRLVEQRCAGLPQADLVRGYVYGSFLDDPRPLGMMLDEGLFQVIHLRVSLGFGAKEGDWFLILPDMSEEVCCPDDTQTEAEAARDWQERLTVAISASEVEVSAILGRVQITLSEALRLRPGDIVQVPETALETLTLESINHEPLGIGRLGQARGQRAVRLTADPGVLTDLMGANASRLALTAQIIPFKPPQASFVPDPPQDVPAPAPDFDAAFEDEPAPDDLPSSVVE